MAARGHASKRRTAARHVVKKRGNDWGHVFAARFEVCTVAPTFFKKRPFGEKVGPGGGGLAGYLARSIV